MTFSFDCITLQLIRFTAVIRRLSRSFSYFWIYALLQIAKVLLLLFVAYLVLFVQLNLLLRILRGRPAAQRTVSKWSRAHTRSWVATADPRLPAWFWQRWERLSNQLSQAVRVFLNFVQTYTNFLATVPREAVAISLTFGGILYPIPGFRRYSIRVNDPLMPKNPKSEHRPDSDLTSQSEPSRDTELSTGSEKCQDCTQSLIHKIPFRRKDQDENRI